MEKLKPFIEELYDTIVTVMFFTSRDADTFENEPIEYIRNQNDFEETLFQPKNQVQELLCHLTRYSSETTGRKKPLG